MRAIVDINGKQYEVEEGRYVRIDRYPADENAELELDNVRLIIAGENTLIGTPFVEGATIKTRVKRHGRGPKVLVYKMRCKKGYRRKNGHRQDFTELLVDVLSFPGRENIAPPPQETQKPEKKVSKSKKSAKTAEAVTAEPVEKEAPAKKSAKSKAEKAPKAEQPAAETKAAVTDETGAPPKKRTTKKKDTASAAPAEEAAPAPEAQAVEQAQAAEEVQSTSSETVSPEVQQPAEAENQTDETPTDEVK